MGLRKTGWFARLAGLAFLACLAQIACALGDNSFRDTKLPDSVRIQNLLSPLTIDEKVLLMSDHPKIPRLGWVLSGQVEGLHGLALGGPAGWADGDGSLCRQRPFRRRRGWGRPRMRKRATTIKIQYLTAAGSSSARLMQT